MQHMRPVPGRRGSAWLTYVYNAISVQFQLQLPTGTELGNRNSRDYRECRIYSTVYRVQRNYNDYIIDIQRE